MCSYFPAFFQDQLVATNCHDRLPNRIKNEFESLGSSFIYRIKSNLDNHRLEQRFHNLSVDQYSDLDEYAENIEILAAELNKSIPELIRRFQIGLPPAVYKWMETKDCGDIAGAITAASEVLILFPAMTSTQKPGVQPRRSPSWQQHHHQDDPMDLNNHRTKDASHCKMTVTRPGPQRQGPSNNLPTQPAGVTNSRTTRAISNRTVGLPTTGCSWLR